MNSKIKSLASIKKILVSLRRGKKKVVFTNGCFDILHYGHIRYLARAKKCGDILVVGLNSDTSVRKLKGTGRPLYSEKDRAGILASLESIDYIVIFSEDTPYRLIKELTPDVLVKGADYKQKDIVGNDLMKLSGGKIVRVALEKNRSTSNIINKIINIYGSKKTR